MDEAVWDASYYQDVQSSSYSGEETGKPCEVLLDTGEDDVLNEISCLQVLRILITNANTEMAQLEDDLVTLQCELALADDAWSEKCSSTLQQEIKILDISILKLKNSIEKGELEFDFEPAKRMHEMLKFLLKDDRAQTNDKDDAVKHINQLSEIASSLDRSNAAEQKGYLQKNLTLELPPQVQEYSKPSMETMEFESEDQEQLVAKAKAILEERIQPADCEKKEENDTSTTLSSLLRVAIHSKRKRKTQKLKVQEADIYHYEDCEKAPSRMQDTIRKIINNEEQIEELKQDSVLKPQKSKPQGRRVPAFRSSMSPQTNYSIQLNFNGRIMVQKALSDVAAIQGHKESPKQPLKKRRRKRSKSSSPTRRHQIFPPKIQETVVETMDRSSTSDPGEKTPNHLSPSTEESQIIEVILDLNCLSLIELKSMAKVLKMSGYAKLKKPQLQEQVMLELKTQGCLTS